MSSDELERRLSRLRPQEPNATLRGQVLASVAEALGPEAPRLDRFLARRGTWVAAAAVVVLLLGAALAEDARHRARLVDLGAPRTADLSPKERRLRWEWHRQLIAGPATSPVLAGGKR